MKNKFLIFFAIISIFSCSEEELNTVPTDQFSSVLITQDVNGMRVAINGIHRFMYTRLDSQGQGGYGGIMLVNESMGEDFVFTGISNGWYTNEARWLSHRNQNSAMNLFPYKFFYRIVANTNILINETAQTPGDINLKNAIIGQAKVYRAFSHFNLVQLYASRYVAGTNNTQPGVPIVKTLSLSGYPRGTVEEVYQFINQDLDEAIVLLGTYSRGTDKSQINRNVAQAIKARVLLTQGRFDEAAQMAINARQGHTLMSNTEYLNGFSNINLSEWMWGCTIRVDQTDFFANFGAYISRNFNSTNIRTNPKAVFRPMYEPFPNSDVRKQLIDPIGNQQATDLGLPAAFNRRPHTSRKFIAVNQGDSRMDVPYVRAAEMFLIEAEAKFRSSNFTNAQAAAALFPLAVNRNPSYTLSTNTGAALLNEILNHRRLELWGEGFRFLDLKRLNLPLNRNTQNGITTNHTGSIISDVFSKPAGTSEWNYLIPQTEINANPLIGPQNN